MSALFFSPVFSLVLFYYLAMLSNSNNGLFWPLVSLPTSNFSDKTRTVFQRRAHGSFILSQSEIIICTSIHMRGCRKFLRPRRDIPLITKSDAWLYGQILWSGSDREIFSITSYRYHKYSNHAVALLWPAHWVNIIQIYFLHNSLIKKENKSKQNIRKIHGFKVCYIYIKSIRDIKVDT